MVNSVDSYKMARYEPSHLDLHCLYKYIYWSVGINRVKNTEQCQKMEAISPIIASRKHAYIILTPLNPTFIL